MPSPLTYLALSVALTLASCQHNPKADNVLQGPVEVARTLEVKTAADVRALMAAYVQTLPNAGLHVIDSARVNDNGPTWQVLVPRRDWARRMPNSAHFEVSKATGEVSAGTVK